MRIVAIDDPLAVFLNSRVIRLYGFHDGEWELLEQQEPERDFALCRLAPGGRGREMFEAVARAIPDEGPITLAGPDITKYHFRAFLDEQYPQAARRVTGCETTDYWPKRR